MVVAESATSVKDMVILKYVKSDSFAPGFWPGLFLVPRLN